MQASTAEQLAEASVEGVEEDVLDGEGVEVVGVELTAALGLAEVAPVGGAYAVPWKRSRWMEFSRSRGVAVALFSVGGELLGDGGEETGGEVAGGDPGEDEEAGVVADPVSHLDLFATLLDYLETLRVPTRNPQNSIVFEWNYADDGSRDNVPNFVVRTKRRKFICCRNNEHWVIDRLFDQEHDPHELNNTDRPQPSSRVFPRRRR